MRDPITVANRKTLGEIRIYISLIGGQMMGHESNNNDDYPQRE